ncbi:MAG: radical SAM protein, partial [Planctomycetes bacterium]|nr:radical SAM protein [Planctomycetota bacterium]
LMSDAVVDRMRDAGLCKLALSVDGFTAETHDRIRGIPGSHERLQEVIERVHTRAPEMSVTLQYVLQGGNLHEAIPFAEWAAGDDRVGATFFMAVMQPHHTAADPTWQTRAEWADLWPRDATLVDRVLDNLASLAEGRGKVGNPVSQLEVFRRYFHQPHSFVKKISCNMVDYGINVNSTGDVFICMNLDRVGNVRDDALARIYYSDGAFRRREEIKRCDKNCEFMVNCFYEEEAA